MKRGPNSRQLFEKVTSVYIALMFSVFLLWPGTEGYVNISKAKFDLFLILCGGYAGVMLLLHLEEMLIGAMKPPKPGKLLKGSSWVQRLMVLYMLLTWVSAVLSPHWPDTVLGVSRYEGALTITIYCFCFLFVSVYAKFQKWMVSVLAVSVLLFDVLCIVQMMGANPLGLYPEGMTWFDANVRYSGAYLGTIGNVDHVASFLCVAVPLLWVAALRLKGRVRILPVVTLAVTLFVLYQMWVLAAVVGVLLGALLTVPVAAPLPGKWRGWLAAGVFVLLILSGLALYFFDLGGGMLHEVHELLHGRVDDAFGSGRIYIWNNVLRLIPENFWFGLGPDTMLRAGIEPFTRVDQATGVLIQASIDTAHNEYLNILFHQGIFALLAYVAALVFAAVGWVKHSRGDWITAAAGGAALCYCVQAFFGISVCITAPYFWLVLAVLDNRTRRNKED